MREPKKKIKQMKQTIYELKEYLYLKEYNTSINN